ncbi:hypothetical protein LTS18_010624, partial [Coniosporium uncinatum]
MPHEEGSSFTAKTDADSQEMTESFGEAGIDFVLTPVDVDECEPISALSVPSPGGFFASLSSSSRHTWTASPIEPTPSTSTALEFYGVPWRKPNVRERSPPRMKPSIMQRTQSLLPEITQRPEWAPRPGLPLRAFTQPDLLHQAPRTRPSLPLREETSSSQETVRIDVSSMRSDATVERVIELTDNGSSTSGPPTALRMQSAKSPSARGENGAIELMYEYDEDYERKLNDHSDSTLDQTSLWLTAQESYLATLRSDDTADAPTTPPPTKEAFSREASPKPIISPAKSVRFAVESPEDSEKQSPRKSPKESTFVRGFKYIRESSTDSDVFVHRKERIEALDLDRRHLSDQHRKQLLGKYELGSPTRTSPKRPISEFLPNDVEDTEQKAILGKAQKERSALLQIKPVSWNLEATKLLNGGTLLTSPAGKAMFHLEEPQ